MAQQVADHFPERINVHVPNMSFHADVDETGMVRMNLGAPATADADGILDAQSVASAGSAVASQFATAYSSTKMGTYGRNIVAVCSGANTDALTIHGRDYLNQPMTETLTLAGATTVAGKKAFKYVDKVVWLDAAGETIDVGWGDVLGLPYKTQAVVVAFEAGDAADDTLASKELTATTWSVADATSAQVTAPFDGYWIGWEGEYTTAMTAAASAITAFGGAAGTTAKTALDGIAPVGVAGLKFGSVVAEASWVAVSKGDIIKLTSDGAGTGGVADVRFYFTQPSGNFSPAIATDPQTATTGDPRGTYDPNITCDGTSEIEVIGLVDRTNLHGVAHYFSG